MTRTTQERLIGLSRSLRERKLPSWKIAEAEPGYGGQGLGEIETIPREIVEAKGWRTDKDGNDIRPDAGYDPAINTETQKRRPANNFYRYIYKRWDAVRDRKGRIKREGRKHLQLAADTYMFHLERAESGASGTAWDGIPPPAQFGSRTPPLGPMESQNWLVGVHAQLKPAEFRLLVWATQHKLSLLQIYDRLHQPPVHGEWSARNIAGEAVDALFERLSEIIR